MKFSKLENQGPFILNEAMPDPMAVFLGQNSDLKKKCVGPIIRGFCGGGSFFGLLRNRRPSTSKKTWSNGNGLSKQYWLG